MNNKKKKKIKIAIVEALRTPIGKYKGIFNNINSVKLGELLVRNILKKTKIKKNIVNSLIFGNVYQTGLGQNIARQISLNSGLSLNCSSVTINEVCGSSLKSIIFAIQEISMDEKKIIIAGGVENMSQAPYFLKRSNICIKNKNFFLDKKKIKDSLFEDGLIDAFYKKKMGELTEKIAKKYNISKKKQDLYSFLSIKRSFKAQKNNKFKREIIKIKFKNKNFYKDELIKKKINFFDIKNSLPIFLKNGTITANNSCKFGDGAAGLLLMSKKMAKKLKLNILAYIEDFFEVGISPSMMGISPALSIKKLIKKKNLKIEDIDRFEINEAFAAQIIANKEILNINIKKINVNGGSIAFGHPLGMSGARIVVTLIHELRRKFLKYGIASICIGGGLGISLLIKSNRYKINKKNINKKYLNY